MRFAVRPVLWCALALLHAGFTPLGNAWAEVPPAEVFTVTPGKAITVTGRGYGHGHGMSQYGAEGAARAGLDHRAIVEFYYPGTTWGSASGKLRVLLTADTDDDLVVVARPGLAVRNAATGASWLLPTNGASNWRLATNRRNLTLVDWRDDAGVWHRLTKFAGDGEFYARGGPVTLVTPTGSRGYRGILRAASPTPGTQARDTVNIVGLNVYLRGVVPREIPAEWSPAAVQAQAVAARTYAAYERAYPAAAYYDLCDTTSCQVYGGVTDEHPATDAAITATKGEVLLGADGLPAFTQFSSSDGGWTAAGSAAYLTAREDPYDGWAGNPVHTWSTVIRPAAVERAWPSIGALSSITVTARDGNGEWGGRVMAVTLTGDKGSKTVTGDDVRTALGLRSTWFALA